MRSSIAPAPARAQQATQQRITQLDSVRGLAALTVVVHHFLLVFPVIESNTYGQSNFWLINLYKYTPLRAIGSGYEAVLLFFLLSGYVLSLPFYAGKGGSYLSFITRRICRIYIPYLCALAVAITLDALFSRHGIAALSGWFNRTWQEVPTLDLVLKHVLLVDSFNSNEYNTVLWSLVQEMRLSLIFPFLMLLVIRCSWKRSLGVGMAVGIVGGFLYDLFPTYKTDIFLSMECVGLFIGGALLAKHRLMLVQAYSKLPRWAHYALFTVGILCYTLPWWLYGVTLLQSFLILSDIYVAAGCALLLVLALASPRLSAVLLQPPITFLGKISFSLYLYHAIILLAAINLLYGFVNIWLILLLAFVLALVVATVAYSYIEKPAIALGRFLSAKSLAFRRISPSNAL
ncbi:MAG TPA: acyltransferase [Ktedonobacterales bacterium]|jgi:peptidoglycan/LPS O-acetylase OafA/YrhL